MKPIERNIIHQRDRAFYKAPQYSFNLHQTQIFVYRAPKTVLLKFQFSGGWGANKEVISWGFNLSLAANGTDLGLAVIYRIIAPHRAETLAAYSW